MVYFYPSKHTTNNNHASEIIEAQEERITDMFALLDKTLDGKEFLAGNHLTVCDFFLFMLSHWADEFKKPPLAFDNLRSYLCRIAKLPSVQEVCNIEGTSLETYK
jgi:glutathione S-transferase